MAKMFRVYSVVERPKQDDYWLNIGVAFPHEKGEGFNVLLQALPLPSGSGICKLVLRPYDPDQHNQEEVKEQAKAKSKAQADP